MREWLSDISVTDTEQRLGIVRATLSCVLNGSSCISVDMALCLQATLFTSPEIRMGLLDDYELWQASMTKRPRIAPFPLAA